MKIKEIFSGLDVEIPSKVGEIDIAHITDDSRDVMPDSLFVCIRGFATDGHLYAEEAVKKGAKVLVVEEELPIRIPQIKVENARALLAHLARNFFNQPDRNLKLIGVTGTNGKSTVTHLISHVLEGLGGKTLLIGTVNYLLCGRNIKAERTTPPPVQLWRLMREAADEGATYVVMEVSSHALALERVENVIFDLSLFTNLSRDHLDFHLTMEDYYRAKRTLFTHHTKGIAVINLDCPFGRRLFEELGGGEKFSYTMQKKKADIKGFLLNNSIDGLTLKIKKGKNTYTMSSSLVGKHNAYNLLAAFASLINLGASPDEILPLFSSFAGVKGRLEKVKNAKKINVFIDYAHTPDALKAVMESLKEISKGRLIVVFGCGGERDKGKRSVMGELACEIADFVVVTSDNPRNEDPFSIIQDIVQGMKKKNFIVEPDRKKAIEVAISSASKGDTVLIAGKGHEEYQVIGDKVIPFSDIKVAQEILKEKGWL